jgi:Domain of unknown function (DUF4263)
MELACKECPDKFRVYAALERTSTAEQDGWAWFHDIPDIFQCRCGKLRYDLISIRRNLHTALYSSATSTETDIELVPHYEKSALSTVVLEFRKLLDSDPAEEKIQNFIEDNLVVLHQFAWVKVFPKPPLLSLYKADFAIVTPQRELILIEIERASTRLMTKGGGEAGPFRHAVDQVHSWLHVADEHRLAVLDSMKIGRDEVGAIRGVVIAGRDAGYDAELMRRFKGINRGRVSALTYDDLLSSLLALTSRIGEL